MESMLASAARESRYAMNQAPNPSYADRLLSLSQCGPGTDMGRLLRRFWQPVCVGAKVKPGSARRIRIMNEDLTLYRGESGKPHLVAGRCAHRLTLLSTGWVQGENIRCIYHGWTYDGAGQCVEAPAEGDETAAKIRIAAYPVREYCGLVFAYMGDIRIAAQAGVRAARSHRAGARADLADEFLPADREFARCRPCQFRPSRRQGRALR
jgi:phenylpropionate dioxygenase-like ring-hydroxylating dioxygenase large terminal subunit